MTDHPGWIRQAQTDGRLSVSAGGEWTIAGAAALEQALAGLAPGTSAEVRFDLSAVERLDTAGVWLLQRAAERCRKDGAEVEFSGLAERFRPLFDLIAANRECTVTPEPPASAVAIFLERVGRGTIAAWQQTVALTAFLGVATVTGLRVLGHPRRLRLVSLVNQVERTGFDALPIVGLMSFLIGVVLAYQGATQLRQFGAEIFTIDLMAISILREIGVLLTAIMIAGRSGSAFTAEIGTMKVNEEIAAMEAIGLDPVEVLVLPRISALVISLPILTLFADFVGMVGGGVMALVSLDLTATQFVGRLQDALTLDHFLVGLVKAPVFAFLIAIVGCFEGLRVSGGAEGVGRLTTRSVVESIFLVIVADAAFSIVFSVIGV
ncbi:MAG: MlaE family lipid ABC transporter permease subunit [Rhodospirillales bacterium]|nr:MAG: MlaE family lipid ABC transporter permease subunit [Rhodospirillales bacterium]